MRKRTRAIAVEFLENRTLFTTYYLDSAAGAGSDANAGTDAQHPWASIAKLNSTPLQPGDSVFLRAGDAFSGTILLGTNAASDPITFDTYSLAPDSSLTYGGATATLNAGNANGISGEDAAGITINDLNIVGSGQAANTHSGIAFDNNLSGNTELSNIQLNNLTVSGFGKYGITIGGSNSKSGFSNVSIANCSVHDNVVGGIETHGVFSSSATTWANSNVTLSYDTVYNNPGYAKSPNHSGDGIVLSDVTAGTIDHCVAYNNGANNIHVGGPVGIWAWDSNNVTIQHCDSHDNHTNSTADGGGFDLDGGDTNCTLQFNYSYNNDGAGYGLFQFSGARPWNNNTVRFNISENDGRKNGYAGIMLYNGGSGINNAQIYNNTIYMTPSASGTSRGIYVETAVNHVGIYNNIIDTTGGTTLVDIEGKQSTLSLDGNDYWTNGAAFVVKDFAKKYTSLKSWQSATGMEMLNGQSVASSAAPGFFETPGTKTDTAYQLLASSAMIGAGLNPAQFNINPGPQDYFGDPLGPQWNIGAD